MIQPGTANALYQWAKLSDTDTRTAQIQTEFEALVARQISGGKPTGTLTSASLNGKTMTLLPDLTATEKLVVFEDVLRRLGVITEQPVNLTYGVFPSIQR